MLHTEKDQKEEDRAQSTRCSFQDVILALSDSCGSGLIQTNADQAIAVSLHRQEVDESGGPIVVRAL